MKLIIAAFSLFVFSSSAHADVYSCAKMVYKDGWLTKYEHLGNTWGANTKKHGVVSSLAGSSVEKTTSSVDPGVSIGSSMSSSQYSSSWGECSMLEMNITKKTREDYIDQNMSDIKKQIAIGEGHHVDSLAYISGCRGIDRMNWSRSLQNETAAFYDINTASSFAEKINGLVSDSPELRSKCLIM